MQSNSIPSVSPERSESFPVGAARVVEPEAVNGFAEAVSADASDAVLLPVRFRPDTSVWEIAERPDHLDKEEWFKLLCARVGANYQARAGGRGFFRVTRTQLEALKVKSPN